MSNKNILIYFPSWGLGGSTIYLGQYVKVLVQKDFSVTCVFRKQDLGSQFLLKMGAKVIFSHFPISLRFTAHPNHTKFTITGGIKDVIKFLYGFFLAFYLQLKFKPTLIFIGEYTLFGCSIPSLILKQKTIFFIQSHITNVPYKKNIVEYFLNKALTVVAITEKHLAPFRDAIFKHTVIHNIVYERKLNGPVSEQLLFQRQNKKVLIFLGGIDYNKGTDLLILIIAQLTMLRSDFIVWIIGPINNDKCYKQIFQDIKKNNLANTINILGEVDNINDYLHLSYALISCNSTPHFMRPVIEAWANKIPVVVADDIYGHYLVDHLINGCISEKSIESWVKNINWLLEDEKRKNELGFEGYNKYKRLYCEENFNVKFNKLLGLIS
jgi:glycosyltransferase involved in cell wall biosynthesis